uniref:Spermatogenesis-associated protein 1 n=1 Tax=Petromyzon marinus TaxID=7757 RepID=A0AAJ7T775_PETMA|nr:spermatogenesis-associated protein 1 [Petromyzon marinus]
MESNRSRPPSSQLVDVHVWLLPQPLWKEETNTALAQDTSRAVSVGFVRTLPDWPLLSVRRQVERDLDRDVPQQFLFLKGMGPHLVHVNVKQEQHVKVKSIFYSLVPDESPPRSGRHLHPPRLCPAVTEPPALSPVGQPPDGAVGRVDAPEPGAGQPRRRQRRWRRRSRRPEQSYASSSSSPPNAAIANNAAAAAASDPEVGAPGAVPPPGGCPRGRRDGRRERGRRKSGRRAAGGRRRLGRRQGSHDAGNERDAGLGDRRPGVVGVVAVG